MRTGRTSCMNLTDERHTRWSSHRGLVIIRRGFRAPSISRRKLPVAPGQPQEHYKIRHWYTPNVALFLARCRLKTNSETLYLLYSSCTQPRPWNNQSVGRPRRGMPCRYAFVVLPPQCRPILRPQRCWDLLQRCWVFSSAGPGMERMVRGRYAGITRKAPNGIGHSSDCPQLNSAFRGDEPGHYEAVARTSRRTAGTLADCCNALDGGGLARPRYRACHGPQSQAPPLVGLPQLALHVMQALGLKPQKRGQAPSWTAGASSRS